MPATPMVAWPSGAPAPAAPQRPGRGWAAPVVVAVLVMAAVTAAILWWPHTASGGARPQTSATPEAAPPPIPASQMDGLLLTGSEAGALFGSGPMGASEDISDRVYTQMVASRTAVDEECHLGTPALAKDHDASGWLALRRQFLATASGSAKNGRSLIQAVVNFPDAATATRFVETSTTTWQHCANRSVNLKMVQDSSSAPNEYWTTGAVSEADGGIRIVFTREGGDGWSCRDSMTARNNVVIELELCGRPTLPEDQIITQISDKIATAS